MRAAGAARRLLLEYRLDSGVAVVKVTGEVDVATSGALRDGLLRVITDEGQSGLVVNLADVKFIDSTGWASWSESGTGSGPRTAAWPWPPPPSTSAAF